jgi:hypothetical protein
VPRIATRDRLKTELLRHTADGLRSHRLSVELEQQASRDQRRREDEIREEWRDSRARTIMAPEQKPQPS